MIFVSPYCRHSRALLTDLAALLATPSPNRPVPLIVSTGSTEENRRIVERLGLTCPFLVQEEMEVGALFNVPATPMAYLVDEDGRTASHLIVGRMAILGQIVATHPAGDEPPATPLSPALLEAETTPAPVNGERYARGLEVGEIAPSFTVPGLDGRPVALSQFRGERVLITFTDLIGPPCAEALVRLEAVHQSGKGPSVVMVARGDPEANRVWAAGHALTMPIGLQRHWDISRDYRLLATPVAVLVDERGLVAAPIALGEDAIVDLCAASMRADGDPAEA
jgi:peroxiredoxin